LFDPEFGFLSKKKKRFKVKTEGLHDTKPILIGYGAIHKIWKIRFMAP